ncbi:MAG: hypothetical protein KI786_08810, partial [Mameliella sp.]|nr:hypothetical protein [Phaeodactylibacter sp.]
FGMVLTLLNSCGTPANTSLSKLDPLIEMSKGPCYGRCPVFTLTIYKNGLASYKGERYTERLGTFVRKLEKPEMERILGEFNRANFSQFRDSYRGRIPDMQSVTISYHENGKKKTVTGKEIRPNAVKWLESQLDQIAHADGWILKEAPASNVPDFLIPDQLLVELGEDTDPEEWAKKYSHTDMTFLRSLNDTSYWIFSYDEETITPEQMLEQVRNDEEVISAEFNKKIYENLDEEKEEEPASPPATNSDTQSKGKSN